MKNEIYDKDIERLFEKVLEQPPILNEIEVHTLLYNSPKPAISGKGIKQFFQTHLNTIIMSTVITSILIGTLLWLSPGKAKQEPTKPQKIAPVTIETSKYEPVKSPKTKVKTSIQNKKVNTISKVNSPVVLFKYKYVLGINNENDTAPKSHLEWDGKPISGELYILQLTNEELKKLGVLVTDTGMYYLNITPNGLISEYSRPYDVWVSKNTKDGSKPKPVKKSVGNSENMISLNSFYVNYSTNEQIINSNNNRISVSINENLKMPNSNNVPYQSLWYRNESNPSVQKLFTLIDSLPKEEVGNFLPRYQPDNLKSIDDTLVPIKIKLQKSELFGVKTKILWFVTNEAFYKALPERYSEQTRKFCESQKLLKKKYPNSNLVDYNFIYEYFDYLDNQVNYIDLTKEELKKLGIFFINDTNEYKAGVEYRDNSIRIKWCKKPNYMMMANNKKDTSIMTVYATYYSSKKEKMLEKIHYRVTNFEQPKMNELIPIRVKKEMPDDFELPDDIIFWYAATEALFDSLPARIGDELKQDYRTIMIRRDPSVSFEEKSKLKSTCKYFEECKATLFDVNFTISPNPVNDEMIIELQLINPERLSITLSSITGRKIKTLLPMTTMEAGTQHFTYPTSDKGNGFFMVTVQNNKGLYKSQKIVKM